LKRIVDYSMRIHRCFDSLFLLAVFVLSACTDIGLPTEYSSAVLPTRSVLLATVSPTLTPTPEVIKTSIPGKSIKVGLLLPMTGSLAYIGEGYKKGIDLALNEIHGKLGEVTIFTITADTGGTPQGTITAFASLLGQSGIDVIIGPGTSPETLAVLPAIFDSRIPVLDATSTNPKILSQVNDTKNEWYFHLNVDEKILAKAVSAKIAKEQSSIAIISDDNPFSRQVAEEYSTAFKVHGLTIIREEYIPATTTEFRPLLFQLRQSRPDALFLIMQEDSCAMLMRQYKTSFTKIPVYARGACTTNLFRQITQDKPDIGSGIEEAVLFSDLQDSELAKEFTKEYSQPLTGHRMAGYYTLKYAVLPTIKSIIESGKTISPETVQEALEQLQVSTPLGLLAFDTSHQAYLNAGLVTNEAGEAKLIEALPTK
jgi:branched-chain amino acid transport system substrate-binding protein